MEIFLIDVKYANLLFQTMKRIIILFFVIGGTISLRGQTPDKDRSWQPVFIDNFSAINNSRWDILDNYVPGDYNAETGEGDEEKYIFLNSNVYLTTSLFFLEKSLAIKLEKRTTPLPHPNGQDCKYRNMHFYTAGRVKSINSYHYGYFEMRTKLPQGRCFFPAFWLHGQQNSGLNPYYNEIDIMEVFGGMDSVSTTNIHYSFLPPFNYIQESLDSVQVNNVHDYHTYAVEWTKSRIIWFVDGKIIRIDANDYDGIGIQNPMYIYFNNTRYNLDSDEGTIYPGIMTVKHISVYDLMCDSLTVVNSIPDFDSYNYALKKAISLGSETVIPNNANITLRATDYIEWRSGFEIPQGTEVFFEVGHYK